MTDRDYFAHYTCEIESEDIGAGSRIWHFSHILPRCKIGNNCMIGQGCMVGPDVTIGHDCKIQNNVSVYKGVTLEDAVFCGPSVVFTNVVNPRAFIEKKDEFTKILVRSGATIGANATIVGNVVIGKYALIGAGSVVTRDVKDYSLVLGVPGKQKGWVCECGEVMSKVVYSKEKSKIGCGKCSREYEHFIEDVMRIS